MSTDSRLLVASFERAHPLPPMPLIEDFKDMPGALPGPSADASARYNLAMSEWHGKWVERNQAFRKWIEDFYAPPAPEAGSGCFGLIVAVFIALAWPTLGLCGVL